MAVATDFNPGTQPLRQPAPAMNMACVKFGLTPEEAWAGVTRHAARALGRQESHGQLAAGFVANFAIWEAEHPVEMVYEPGRAPLWGARGTRRTAMMLLASYPREPLAGGVMIARRRPMRCACSRPSPARNASRRRRCPAISRCSALPATKVYGVIKGVPAPGMVRKRYAGH